MMCGCICTEDSPGSGGGCGCGSVEDGEVLTSGTAAVEGGEREGV